ncbi:MAG: Fe-S cluster assembly protein SufD, partial [Candidatus Zixiibacteriota bacterium]
GPLWLREKRRLSCETFNETPLPRRGLHLWRYTDPAGFLVRHSGMNETSIGDSHIMIEQTELRHLSDGNLTAVVTDVTGRDISVHRHSTTPSNLTITTLSSAVESHQDLIRNHLYLLVNEQTGKFEALNSALWNDGIFIHVPDNTTIKGPIHLLRQAGQAGSVQYPRLLVITGKNAEVTIIDEYGGGAPDFKNGYSYSNAAVEIFGREASRTSYVALQRHSPGMQAYLTHRAHLKNDAQMMTIPLVFGAAVSKQNFGITLDGAGARSQIYGLVFGGNRQHLDNHTLHHHAHGHTTSDINMKVVLRDRALSAYTGLIRIDKEAKNCEAYQENRNLLLSKGTRAETIPELEILNEEVSCSHGATVGPVDPMQIFQLCSRGIPEKEAIRMIVSGFVASSLSLLPENLSERVGGFVASRLEDM